MVIGALFALAACSGNGSNGAGGAGASGGGSGTGGASGGGTGGTGGAGGGNAGLPQSMLCEQVAAALCARELACKTIDSAQSANCLAAAKQGCTANIDKLLTAGARTYDGVKGQACVTAITAQKCIEGQNITLTGGVANLPAECAFTNFLPKGTLNTPCSSTSDCTTGFCGAPTGACATCLPFAAVNQGCNFTDKRCDPVAATCVGQGDGGSICQGYIPLNQICTPQVTCDPATGFCPPGNADGGLPDGGSRVCTAKLPDGQVCAGVSSRCQSAYCSSFPDAGSVCGFRPLNSGCTSHASCGPDAYCKGYLGFGFPDGVCTARVMGTGACTNQYADSDSNGDPRDGCKEGSCIGGNCKLPDFMGGVGAECDRQIGNCTEANYCKDFDADQPDGGPSLGQGSCTPRLDQDAGCEFFTYFDLDCKQGFQCNNADVCDELKSAGGACQGSLYCKDLLNCQRTDGGVNGLCTPWQQPGSDCTPLGTTCSNGAMNERVGFCLYDAGLQSTTGPGTCSALQGANAACASNAQCASGRCRRADGGSGSILLGDGGREFGTCVTACLP